MPHAPESSAADRITVALIPAAASGLALLQERTGLSGTDLVNRAISLYEFTDAQIRDGADILVRRGDETHLVTLA